MNQPIEDPTKQLRWMIYWVLITLSIGSMIGRILAVNSTNQSSLERYRIKQRLKQDREKWIKKKIEGTQLDELLAKREIELKEKLKIQRPFLSGNDRSRWIMIRALVEHGTYQVDEVIAEKRWDTIDMVKHKDAAGQWHLYSSKPPLIPTLIAAEYWVIHKITGKTLGTHPYAIGRFMLITINVIPMLVMFILLAKTVEQYAQTDWARVFIMAAATFGTMITTFAVVLNNHLAAVVCTMVACYAFLKILNQQKANLLWYGVCGLFAGLLVANELPALIFSTLISLVVVYKYPRNGLLVFTPAALLIAAAYFGVNYIAHDSWRPPYAHRTVGKKLFKIDADVLKDLPTSDNYNTKTEGQAVADSLKKLFGDHQIELNDFSTITVKEPKKHDAHWSVNVCDEHGNRLQRYSLVQDAGKLMVHEWDDWYDYQFKKTPKQSKPNYSYWIQRRGIDRGESSRLTYATHVLIGHHGIFSLTPIWLMSFIGLILIVFKNHPRLQMFAWVVVGCSVICIGFYLARPLVDRNYGGSTSGFRWAFWMIPLWLIAMIPTLDAISKKRTWRTIALILLAISALSASYPTWNPWTAPWLMNFLEYCEVI